MEKLSSTTRKAIIEGKLEALGSLSGDFVDTGYALVPSKIKNLTDKALNTPLVKHAGQEESKWGLVERFEGRGITYLIEAIYYQNQMKKKPPKVYVSQDKNIKLLLALTERQQYLIKKTKKRPEAEFSLKDYLMCRGYTEQEIAKGGKFIEEGKRDLYSGAYTIYQLPIKRKGKNYIRHGALYSLEVPENRKSKWRISWNGGYGDSVLKVLNKEKGQYFKHYLKEIADRKTTEKPYLHYFYNQLVARRQKSSVSMAKKIKNLLREMGTPENTLKERPKDCYKRLRECLLYTAKNYPEELSKITLYNNYRGKKEKKQQDILFTEKTIKVFYKLDYNAFMADLFKRIGENDIRNCYIAFTRKTEPEAMKLLSFEEEKRQEEEHKKRRKLGAYTKPIKIGEDILEKVSRYIPK
jgi:hypothetical protein